MKRLTALAIGCLLTVTGCGSNGDDGSATPESRPPTVEPTPRPATVRPAHGVDNGVTFRLLDASATTDGLVVDVDVTGGRADTLVKGGTYIGPDKRQYDDPVLYDTVRSGATKTMTLVFPKAGLGGTLRLHAMMTEAEGDYDAYVNLPVRPANAD